MKYIVGEFVDLTVYTELVDGENIVVIDANNGSTIKMDLKANEVDELIDALQKAKGAIL